MKFQALGSIVFADDDLLDLIELMDSVKPVRIFAGGAGFRTESTLVGLAMLSMNQVSQVQTVALRSATSGTFRLLLPGLVVG